MTDRRSGIYKILNKINGKIYIGSAADFYERWHSHKHYLNRNNHHNEHLQRAWNKHGAEAFEFIIIETCCKIKEVLLDREQYWINVSKCCDPKIGYNIRLVPNTNVGLVFTDAHRAKMSAWQIGTSLSDEHKEKLSAFNMGKKLSDETKMKMSMSHRKQFDKFLCPDKTKCKCDKCKADRREYHRLYMRERRAKLKSS